MTDPFRPMSAIDTHAHVYPSWYLDQLETIGISPKSTAIARIPGADSTSADLARRWKQMDSAGVGLQIIAATPQVPAGHRTADSTTAAQAINDHYAQLVAEHPDRLRAYSVIPLPHVAASVAEAVRALDYLDFLGVSLTTTLADTEFTLSSPNLDPLWQVLDERASVVNIHPTGHGVHSPLIRDHGLAWVNGAPVEDATAVLHLLQADVPRRFPNIQFHIAHLGGDLPFLAQRIEDNYTDWDAFPSSPLESLRRMWFDAANFHTPSLLLADTTLGTAQILAGSDHPYFQDEKYIRAFSYIRDAPLPIKSITAVMHGNALYLYGDLSRKTTHMTTRSSGRYAADSIENQN